MEIQAIETQYNGYRFRSRLEARWAVFFDAADIKYEYEPEGFILNDGTHYLPDFYLPDFKLYVEVKPNEKTRQEQGHRMCNAFHISTGRAIFCTNGGPADNQWGMLYAWELSDSGGGDYEDEARFVAPDDLHVILLTMDTRLDRTLYTSPTFTEWSDRVLSSGELLNRFPYSCVEALRDKLMYEFFTPGQNKGTINWMREQARSARFEHGETPNVRRNA